MKGIALLAGIYFLIVCCSSGSSNIVYTLSWRFDVPWKTCNRVGAGYIPAPSSYLYGLPWNVSTMVQIVSLLGQVIDTSVSPMGLRGCCVPGLWCRSQGCFTQGFGNQFVNGDWLMGDNSSFPVIACLNTVGTGLTLSSRPKVTGSTLTNSQLTLYGSGLGSNEQNITNVRIGMDTCNRVELCSGHQCRTCVNTGTCPLDTICLSDQSSLSNSCYMICTMQNDTSCPCDHACQTIPINIRTSSIYLSICVPTDGTGTCSLKSHSADELRCLVPRASQLAIASATYSNISVQSVWRGAAVATLPNNQQLPSCTIAQQSSCYDGDICTSDSCRNGYCFYTPIPGCSSTLQAIRERDVTFVYHTYAQPGQQAMHSSFYQTMRNIGIRKTVMMQGDRIKSKVNIPLPFRFVFFGNIFNELTVNPDGTISFPPYADCSVIGCITFSTFSNTIVAWSGGRGSSSTGLNSNSPVIYTYPQRIGDGSLLGGIDATGYHILFDSFLDPYTSALQTFSISLYDDHSIRFQYLKASKGYPEPRTTFFGLWGSRASRNFSDIYPNTVPNNPSSYLRYHMENISTNVVVANSGGNNVLFCYQSQVLGCIVDACVGPTKPLVLRWGNDTGFPSCQAAGMARGQVRIQCVWAGGLAITQANYILATPAQRIAAGNGRYTNVLQCTVPSLNVADNTIVSVDIVVGMNTPNTMTEIPYPAGAKASFGVSIGTNGELAHHQLMVRYNSLPSSGCGCSPLSIYPNRQCDSSLVCGGATASATAGATSPHVDCAGEPFGRAYLDDCMLCAGGSTMKSPYLGGTCSINDDRGPGDANPFVYQPSGSSNQNYMLEIVLLSIMCGAISCMLLMTALCLRRLCVWRQHHEGIAGTELNPWDLTPAVPRGLTESEQAMLIRHNYESITTHRERQGLAAAVVSTETDESIDHNQRHRQDGKKGSDLAVVQSTSTTETLGDIGSGNNVGDNDSGHGLVECSICLIVFEQGTTVITLPEPCGHVFHAACIEHWFQNAHSCPLCKRSIREIISTLTGTTGTNVTGGTTIGVNADAVVGVNDTTGIASVPSSSPPRNVVIPSVPSTSNTTAATTPTAIALPLSSSSSNNNNFDTLRLISIPNNPPHAPIPLSMAGGSNTMGSNLPPRGITTSPRSTDNTSSPSTVGPRNGSVGSSGSWGAVFTRSMQRFSTPWRQYQPAGRLEEGEGDQPSPINHRPPDAIPSNATITSVQGTGNNTTLYSPTATSHATTAPGI